MNNKIEASMKYNAANTVQFLLRLNKNTDAELIRHLQSKDNKQGYIKSLIRHDMSWDQFKNK